MANKIIAFIPFGKLKASIAKGGNLADLVIGMITGISQTYSSIRISSSLSDEDKVRRSIYPDTDNIIFYQDNGPICLGKWASTTIQNTESFNKSQYCTNTNELFTKLNNHINENRLQEPEAPSRERNEREGVAIEVARELIEVETRPLDNGTVISC